MSKYEQAISEILSREVPKLNINLYELAEDRIERFVATLYRLLVDQQEHFDLIVGAGDSGCFAVELTKLVYQEQKKQLPPILLLPIVRFKNDKEGEERFDNSYLKRKVKNKLKEIESIRNILFVDDEIRKGWTAKSCFELICPNYDNFITGTIVAEHHFFEWHYNIPRLSIRYFSYAKSVYGIIHIFSYIVDDILYKHLQEASDKIVDRNQVLALLSSGGYRKLEGRRAYFDSGLEKGMRLKFDSYNKVKKDLRGVLTSLVKRGIKKYKEDKICFKF